MCGLFVFYLLKKQFCDCCLDTWWNLSSIDSKHAFNANLIFCKGFWYTTACVAQNLDLHQHFLAHDATCFMFQFRPFWQVVKITNTAYSNVLILSASSRVVPKMAFDKVQETAATRFIFSLKYNINHKILQCNQWRFILMIKETGRVTTLACWWV